MGKSIITPTAPKASDALRTVLYFANLQPTEQSWRRDILRPFERLVFGSAAPATLPETPVFGVASQQELGAHLEKYRSTITNLIETRDYSSGRSLLLWASLCQEAKLTVKEWHQSPQDGRAFPEWETTGNTFTEMLYSFVLHALSEVSPASIHRCSACNEFYYEPSRRKVKYCSDRCKKRILMQRYRARQRVKTG